MPDEVVPAWGHGDSVLSTETFVMILNGCP